ncbi:peptide deformylase [Christensenellaceae bacterium NSJ-63]|uniref:Peptide deformylase n=1 Tax=Guopingia tenuis TaxID=2763656 RepID=A0A926HW68_9FIRM|nr:peptide deformylase [Guopingia tenuis]MBC8538038.1 peptide deformylase [Guopingia tenuis]MBS5644975.1 peptide deformylase [Clostridiales bacterium]
MALRNIIQEPSEQLRKISRPVKEITPRIEILLDDLAETMKAADGVGLAAPQVGVLRRAVVIDIGDEHGLIELINPVITFREGEQKGEEGCLSCGSRRGVVTRPMKVTVVAKNRKGMEVTYDAEGLLARAMCHEIDHLDGHLFIDVMEEELFDDDEEVLDGEIADDEE